MGNFAVLFIIKSKKEQKYILFRKLWQGVRNMSDFEIQQANDYNDVQFLYDLHK